MWEEFCGSGKESEASKSPSSGWCQKLYRAPYPPLTAFKVPSDFCSFFATQSERDSLLQHTQYRLCLFLSPSAQTAFHKDQKQWFCSLVCSVLPRHWFLRTRSGTWAPGVHRQSKPFSLKLQEEGKNNNQRTPDSLEIWTIRCGTRCGTRPPWLVWWNWNL